jgi:hypothetical protein
MGYFLKLSAFFDPANIGESIFRHYWEGYPIPSAKPDPESRGFWKTDLYLLGRPCLVLSKM